MITHESEAEVLQWRKEQEDKLRSNERSWLNLAGLFWLKDGDNSFGNDPKCDFVLPPGTPKKAGTFKFEDGLVTIKAEPNVPITCNGGELPSAPLKDDQQEHPDFLYLSHFILVVIIRGDSTLIRLWDTENPARREFTGLKFFPYQAEYCILAKYTGYAPYKTVKTEDIIGEVHDSRMIGYIIFEREGISYRLDAENEGDGLFIAFKDKTTAKTTYAGGRYLVTGNPENGEVLVDFNKAYNMPCAYALYATCGLPTKENVLSIPIEAGEKKYRTDN